MKDKYYRQGSNRFGDIVESANQPPKDNQIVTKIAEILKNVHTMGMSDQLIGTKEHYSDKQLELRKQAILAALATAIRQVVGDDEVLDAWPVWYSKTKSYGGSRKEYDKLRVIINHENNFRSKLRETLRGLGLDL